MEKNEDDRVQKMNELDSFTINFITNGIDKLQDGIKDIRKDLDSLNDSFTTGTNKGNTFFDKFGGWIAALSSLAAGFIGIRDAINGVFNVSGKIVNLNLTADSVNRTALEVETLSRALLQFSDKVDVGEMFGEAGKLYRALDTITGKAWRLQFGTELTEELNRAGGIMFKGNESDQEMLSKIIQGLEYHRRTGTSYDKNRLAQVLGLSETAVAFLSSGEKTVDAILKKEREKSHLYTEENLKAADALMTARRELKDTWDKIYTELQPEVTYMVEQFTILVEKLKPVIKLIVQVVSWIIDKYNFLLNGAEKIGEKAGKGISKAIDEIRYSRAFKEISDWIDSKDWEKSDFGDINKKLTKAKSYVDIFADTEENRETIKKATEMAQILANNRWNAESKSSNVSNSGNIVIEEINVEKSEDVGKAVNSIKQQNKSTSGLNTAWLGGENL